MKFQKLDKERLGDSVFGLALASHSANHKKVLHTVRDYLCPGEGDLEGQFVRDLFVLTTEELIDKWFDGEENASQLIMGLMER